MKDYKTVVTLPTPENGAAFSIKPVDDDSVWVMGRELKKGQTIHLKSIRRKWWQLWKQRYFWRAT